MSRKCAITGKAVMTGNNVSHANNRTRRRFLPNLQQTSFYSEVLGQMVQMRISTRGMRTIEKNGGFDAYIQNTSSSKLPLEVARYKKLITKKVQTQAQS
ncbi:MAG: 50S ribosomal protein L28 [Pseudomonadota bacterium]